MTPPNPMRNLAIGVAIIAAAFAFGRYTAPGASVKTKEDTKIVDTTHTDENKHVKTVETITELPDGTKKTERTITDDSTTKTDEVVQVDDKKSTEVTLAKKNTLNISVLAGVDIRGPYIPIYGASVTKEVLGPISVGVWGLTTGVVGASVGLSF